MTSDGRTVMIGIPTPSSRNKVETNKQTKNPVYARVYGITVMAYESANRPNTHKLCPCHGPFNVAAFKFDVNLYPFFNSSAG